MGCYRNFVNVDIIGKKINDETSVVSKLINRSNPIEEVPWWEEKNSVPNEHIVVKELVKQIENLKENKAEIDGQVINDILTVNGVRFSFEDGSWGLIRASSNKPSLVIVTESPTSDERKKKIFDFIDDLLQKTGKVGEYDQKI